MAAIVLRVTLEIVADQMDAFVDRVCEHRRNVLKSEPNCQRFDISIPDQNENTIQLYEVYADEAAFDHHMETPYMKAYMEETAPMIENRERIRATLLNEQKTP